MHDLPPRPLMASTFRSLPRTGVIYAMTEARRHGYTPDDPAWVNFGQGAPEVGDLEGKSAPSRGSGAVPDRPSSD